MSTRGPASPSRAAIRRVASMPSISGMRMSISTTSGVSRRALSTACVPSEHSPTTSMSSSASRIIRKPARISAWSSTSSTRMLMPAPAVGWGARARTAKPPSGSRARLHDAAVHRRALAHADEAVAAARVAQLVVVARALAVVLDAQHHLVRLVGDRHACARARRVLERVGERLLDDPVRGQVDAGGQLDRVAGHAQLHAQPGVARASRQLVRRARCSARPRAAPRRRGAPGRTGGGARPAPRGRCARSGRPPRRPAPGPSRAPGARRSPGPPSR